MFNKTIQNVNDVREFVMHLIQQEELSFHPDTDFSEYVTCWTFEFCHNPRILSGSSGRFGGPSKGCNCPRLASKNGAEWCRCLLRLKKS